MQTVHDYVAAASSYIIALLVLAGTLVADNASGIAQVLGFILLVARLIQEVPGAIRVVRKWVRRE